jgi:hypothetical protein
VHTFAAPSANRRINRAGTAPVHVLFFLRPIINAFRAWISFDHSLVVIARLVCQTFQCDEVARNDFDHWLEILTEISPMNCLVSRREMPMVVFDRKSDVARNWYLPWP